MNKARLLVDLCEVIMGQSPDSSTYNQGNHGLPFYQGSADFGEIHPITRIWCSKPKKIAEKDDILISVRAPIGDLNIASEKCCIGRGVASIRVKDKNNYDMGYLFYFLRSQVKHLRKQGNGSTFAAINKGALANLHIPLIGYADQKKIVEVLDAIVCLVEKKKRQIEDLNNLVKSRFMEMFGDPIQNEKAWNSLILNEVTDVRDGTHDSPKYHDRGYPLVTSKNLIDGKIDFATCQLISEEDYLHFNDRSRVDDGDILMPMIGTIGGAIIVKKDREFSIKNVALIKFTKDNTKINRTFILYLLNSDSMNNYFELTKKGGTQKFIALGVIRNIPIIVPPIELQNEFAKFANQIDKSRFVVQKEIKDLQELLDSKMDEYFGGEE